MFCMDPHDSKAYAEALDRAAMHLVKQVTPDGYVSASPTYRWYFPHWIRDSSFIAIALLHYASFVREDGPGNSAAARAAARHINEFNCTIARKYSPGMSELAKLGKGDSEFLKLKHHIYARMGKDGDLAKLEFTDGSGRTIFMIDDTPERERDSWLRQYDSIPLILLALETEAASVGLSDKESAYLKEISPAITEYMHLIFRTPCSNIWELEKEYMHAYNLAAIYCGMGTLRDMYGTVLSGQPEANAAIRMIDSDMPEVLVELKKLVHDGILYRRMLPGADVDVGAGVGTAELFAFTRFGISDAELGVGVVRNTVSVMLRDRFGENTLPTRYKGDTYFTGGRWLLLGLELAASGLAHDRDADRAIDYVIGKYGQDLPEQELVDPESPSSPDGLEDLRKNGNATISPLNWSYAALADAIIRVLSGPVRQPAMRHLSKS